MTSAEVQVQIARNLAAIQARITEAAERANRDPASARLVAVTKYAELEWVNALVEQGQRHLGESRPQQLQERQQLLPETLHWHLIGHLQRNKVRPMLETGAVIHSVDSFRLLERIERLATELDLRPQVLLEVNVSGETAKDGFNPEELRGGWRQCLELSRTRILGLMTMAPHVADPEETRSCFRQLRVLRDWLVEDSQGRVPLEDLSMGMSGDFEPAIEEGATLVRIGSSLFEGLGASQSAR